MAGTLAPTTFVSAADRNMAVVDVYKKANSTTVNAIEDITQKYNFDVQAALQGGLQAFRSMAPIVQSFANGTAVISKQALLNRILAATSVMGRTVTTALKDVKDDGSLQSTIAGYVKEGAGVVMKVGNVAQRVASTNLTNLNAVGSLINSISGEANRAVINDRDSTAAVLSGVISEASRYGIPQSYSSVMSAINDSVITRRVVAMVLPDVVKGSDHRTLQDMAQASPVGALKMLNPNVLGDFGSTYQAPLGSTTQKRTSDFSEILTAFTAVDPKWNTAVRQTSAGAESVVNLSQVTSFSKDLQRTFDIGAKASENIDDKLFGFASMFGKRDVASELSKAFPMSVAATSTRTAPRVVSPLTLTA